MRLQVLLVEDEQADLNSYMQDLPKVFSDRGIDVDIHPFEDFDRAIESSKNPRNRYDLIVSDTYKGRTRNNDAAAVLSMVSTYRQGRFCPLVVYSSGVKPADLVEGPFVVWADKSKADDIERAISEVLDRGIPQLAAQLHAELDQSAGSYLWDFIESKWDWLEERSKSDTNLLSRMIRRRAALKIADTVHSDDGQQRAVTEIDGVEFYIYPPLDPSAYRLGQIVRSKQDEADLRVVLTPHCQLVKQPNQSVPRASHVLTVRTVPARDVLGDQKVQQLEQGNDQAVDTKLRRWTTPPSHKDLGLPAGRYWYLPKFIDIPHQYCDFMLLESLEYQHLVSSYDSIAVLVPPFAESLQACFIRYYSAIGIPNLRPGSISDISN